MGAMRVVYGRLPYELSIVELEPGETVERDGYLIAAVPVSHRARVAFGYALVEDAAPGPPRRRSSPSSSGSRPGPDFGRLQRGETVAGVAPEQVMGPTREGRKIVLSGDTAPCEALAIAAHEADVLVHEATFAEEEAERARETAHSTARQAAELAREAEVRLLALTHISTRYAGGELRDEARAVFAATEAPRDFDTIEVPFPERGAADARALVRAPGARARAPSEPDAERRPTADAERRRDRPDTFAADPLTRSREARKETMDRAARRSSSARTTCSGRSRASRTRSSSATRGAGARPSSASTAAAPSSRSACRTLLEELLDAEIPLGDLDIGFYRDDVASRPDAPVVHASHIDFDVTGRTVVIVDDVLYTGRTVRAAIEALFDYGRPERVQLAVLADRGHRELPIRPDYVGKNLPTSRAEHVHVRVRELDGVDEVAIAAAPRRWRPGA